MLGSFKLARLKVGEAQRLCVLTLVKLKVGGPQSWWTSKLVDLQVGEPAIKCMSLHFEPPNLGASKLKGLRRIHDSDMNYFLVGTKKCVTNHIVFKTSEVPTSLICN